LVAAARLSSFACGMKTRNTLILLALTVAVACFIIFYEKERPNTEEAQHQSQNLVNFSPDKVDGIIIQNGDDKIELQRRDKKWRLESPIKDQADASLIDNLLMDVDGWRKDATISAKEIEADKNRLNEYGLNKPKLRLKLLGEGAPPEILLGKDAALEGKIYVRFENAKDSYVVSQTVKNAIDKKPDDFRDKKLTDLNMTQISRVVLKTPAGEFELAKKGDHWEIVRPLRARGDDQRIGDWLAQITTARIQQFVADDRGDLHPYGLTEPRGSITLFGENDKSAGRTDSSHGEQGQMLQIGAVPEKQKDQVYVRFSSRGFVYTLPKKIAEMLNARPDDLRDRHLVRLDPNILDRITIDAPGKNKTVLARKDENWTIVNQNNAPANASEVRRLTDTIGNEQVTKFVEDVASNLAKYGLDKPQLQLTFSSFASENTAETKAGERPIATISFGRIDGENVYAHIGDEPFVLAVRRALLDSVWSDPVQWQDLAVFKFKPEQIHRVSLKSEKEVELVRGANNQWNWVKGSGPINQTNMQSLLNTLANLHAVRWVGATTPPHGFEKPPLVITFTTAPDDKAVHKLTVGGPSGAGMWFAKVDEREGTFAMNNPDLNALKLSLVETAVPTPAPMAIGSPTPPGVTSPVAAPTP
jgi:Domain of unknown function (DUF4340)